MIKRTRRVHGGYSEWQKAVDENPAKSRWNFNLMFQKWQYFYKKGGRSMDLVQFCSHMYDGRDFEIYGVIDDVERFTSMEEAEKRIEEVLGDKIQR